MKLKHCHICNSNVIPNNDDCCPNCDISLFDSSVFDPDEATGETSRNNRQRNVNVENPIETAEPAPISSRVQYTIRVLSILLLALSEFIFLYHYKLLPKVDFAYVLFLGPPVATIIYAMFTDHTFRRWFLIFYSVIEVLPIGIVLAWSAFLGSGGEWVFMFLIILSMPFIYARIDRALTRRRRS